MRLALLFVLCCSLGQGIAQYTLYVLLEEFSNGAGFLADGTRCNSRFWFTPNSKCNLQLQLCVEPLSGPPSSNPDACNYPQMNGGYVDLGNVTWSQNSIVFKGDGYTYGGWSNPYIVSVASGTFQGFRVKVKATNFDFTRNAPGVIDQYVYTFSDGSQAAGSSAYSNPRPNAPQSTL
uniref:Fibrinogen C-terminal domain-containing protein n=1 Tax=Plectus sambesii TaxID=2011161 RepID=A0A914X6Z4_9BILA